MKKYKKWLIGALAILLVIITIGFTVGRKSTQQDLQDNKWYFNQDGQSYQTQFNKKTMVVESLLVTINGTYSITTTSGKEYLNINTNDAKNQKFHLASISDGYKATAVNKSAKAETGLGSFELQKRK